MERQSPMIRAPILITPEQRRRLETLASREGRSLSGITRRALQLGLDILERRGDEMAQQRLAALPDPREMRRHIEQRQGVYQGDLVAEVRAERENDEAYASNRRHHLTWLERGADLGTEGTISWQREDLHGR